jgi:ferredoxin-type protein NapH
MQKRQKVRKAIIIGSFLFFPITIFYFSPNLVLLGAMDGIVVGSFIMFSIQFALSLFLGRAPCSYFCPIAGLHECLAPVTDKKAKGGWRNLIKYCIWVPWVVAIALMFVRAGGFREFDFFFHTANGVSLREPFSYFIYYGVILLVVAMAFAAGKSAFCHYVCWMAPFMVVGTKLSGWLRLPRLRLEPNKDGCTKCKICTKKCPMSLDVMQMVEQGNMENAECTLCGECIDSCPQKAIRYKTGIGK